MVHLSLGHHLAGVDSGHRGMAAAARRAGLPVDVIGVVDGEGGNDGDVIRVPYRAWTRAPRLQKLFRYRALESARLDRYDVVFLRYPGSIDLDPGALFRHPLAERVATVHHTHEFRELASGKRTPGIAARVFLEWAAGRRILSRIDGIVGVTDEIRAFEVSRSGREPPSAAVSNGIDVGAIALTRFKPFDGRTLRLVLVASGIAPWHGWDRMVGALQRPRRDVRVVVDAVGSFNREVGAVDQLEGGEIRYHGTLQREALGAVLGEANLAVSSLALHRLGLRQGCVLKTREYTARGLPFVYAYDDPDLNADDPFCLRLPSDDTPVDMDRIIDFARAVATAGSALSDQARATALERMDWAIKLQSFVEFGTRILG